MKVLLVVKRARAIKCACVFIKILDYLLKHVYFLGFIQILLSGSGRDKEKPLKVSRKPGKSAENLKISRKQGKTGVFKENQGIWGQTRSYPLKLTVFLRNFGFFQKSPLKTEDLGRFFEKFELFLEFLKKSSSMKLKLTFPVVDSFIKLFYSAYFLKSYIMGCGSSNLAQAEAPSK